MKYAMITALALAMAATSYAGCGKKAASIGKVQKYDPETKALTLRIFDSSDPKELAAKKAKLTLTPASKILAAEKVEALVGKRVSVVSEHGKIDYVIALAPREKKAKATEKAN